MRTRLIVPAIFVALACAASASGQVSPIQIPGMPPPALPVEVKPGEECTIEGLVVKAGTNEPIRRAILTLTFQGPQPGVRTYTDAAGKFAFRDLAPGRYFLTAERQGFVRQVFGQRGLGQMGASLELRPGQTVRDLVFRMVPWSVISGRVLDEEGEPLIGAGVEVLRYAYVRGRRQLQRTQGASTNDLGEYRIFGLQPGRYFVSASYGQGMRLQAPRGREAAAQGQPRAAVDEGYAPTYYPGTTDPGRAEALELRGGQEVSGLDFSLQLQPTMRVRGRVTSGQTGQPVRGANVMLVPRDAELRPFLSRNQAVTQGAQGDFEIRGIIPGNYFVAASWAEQGRGMSARQPVDISTADVEGIQLTLTPGFALEGRVRVEGGELPLDPRARTDPSATPGVAPVRLSTIRVQMIPSEDAFMGITNTNVRQDGAFTFRDIAPGKYTPTIAGAPETYYLKSVQLGGRNLLETGIDLNGPPAAPLELVVSPKGGRVEGVVVTDDQKPVPGAVVVLVPDAARRQMWPVYRTVTADTSGRFTIGGLAPGEYKLFAWLDVEPGAPMDPEFLRPYEERGVVVRVEEGGRYSHEVKLLPSDTRLP